MVKGLWEVEILCIEGIYGEMRELYRGWRMKRYM